MNWEKSTPTLLEFAADNIDAATGVIKDVVMVQEGPALGHGVELDAEFINQIVAYDQAHFSKTGIKARFGHPNASNETMGTQMGYFQNFRVRKKAGKMQAIADLHLLDSANLSPEKPNMKDWMLSMAAEAPDFIMSSIVFSPTGYFQKYTNGKKKALDPNGDNYDPEQGPVYVDFGDNGQHYYTDLVEAGAATTSLFSNQVNEHLFVVQVENFIENNPKLKQFIKAHPDRVQKFLQTLGIAPKKTLSMSIKELFFGANKPEDDVTLSAAEVTELREKMASLETKFAALETENAELKGKLATAETALATANEYTAKYKQEAEAAKEDARKLHTEGKKGIELGKTEEVELDINKRAAAIAASRKA